MLLLVVLIIGISIDRVSIIWQLVLIIAISTDRVVIILLVVLIMAIGIDSGYKYIANGSERCYQYRY